MATTTQSRPAGGPEDLRRYRKAAGLTQIELAKQSGVSLAFLRNVEQGHVPKNSPTFARLLSLLEDADPAGNGVGIQESAGTGRHVETP